MRLYVVKDIAGRGGRWLDVAPARLPGWMASFARRHGAGAPDAPLAVALVGETVIFTAPDGAVAECHPPFPPVPGLPPAPAGAAEAIAAHALRPRTVGVLLVRLGGYAAGVFTGSPPELAASKTGSRPVHGRSAAGGWSQHRFARRREKQASEALQAAATAAVTVFGGWGVSGVRSGSVSPGGHSAPWGSAFPGDTPGTPWPRPRWPGPPANTERAEAGRAESGRGRRLDAVVLGGDKRAVAELRDDPRLAPYLELAVDRFLTVPDPRLAVLKDVPRLFLAVKIKLTEPTT
jgi:Actinobacteria/chloroflexi VLRF1 release factor